MNQYQDSPTFRLFSSTPSFMKGFGRIFDFSGSLNRYHNRMRSTSEKADSDALKSDWEAVGRDIRVVLGRCKKYGK